jgi:TRAP transporter 4TM/12TM fusion protein
MSELSHSTVSLFGWNQGFRGRTLFLIALSFSVFQVYTAAYSPLSSSIVRAIHVGFLTLLIFGLYPNPFSKKSVFSYLSWPLGIVGFSIGFYHWFFEADLIQRAGDPSTLDLIVGSMAIVLIFEAARRMMGVALPVICLAFLAYALFGYLLPDFLMHRGYDFSQVVDQIGMGEEGIYGIPTYVSSSYIFLFILFGSFLEQAGMIKLFTDFALGTVGHTKGGPAKVSVISSGLMGTINGSGVANVVTTGQFTIPLMKKFGYRAEFAGGVEATASMGGQIMPPVMGAVAFIMAETLDVPYTQICIAAAIPALLYFMSALWMVHLEAGRAGLVGLSKAECPDAWLAIKAQWYLLVPLLILVALLFSGYTPLFSGTVGLCVTAVLIFGTAIAVRLNGLPLRIIYWLALAFICSAFVEWGISVFFSLIAVLALLCAFVVGGRDVLKVAITALVEGAKHALPVGIACALVGVIIGVLTLTGAATNFAGMIIALGEKSLFLSLVLTMLVCLVLGMGIPTIPNYIITSSLAAPALLELGVPLIVSHMFVFYFGIMADLTPPVALAAFAASPIAQASGMKIGIQAVKIAIAGFVVPYMAVYSPALMLQGDPTVMIVVYIVLKAILAIGLWGAATTGYLFAPLTTLARLTALIAAFLLVAALPITDELGFALVVLFVSGHLWQCRIKGLINKGHH